MFDERITVTPRGTSLVTALSSDTSHVVLTNEGSSIVYVGQNPTGYQGVTAALGVPLNPGQQLDITGPTGNIYGATDPGSVSDVTGTVSSEWKAGSSTVALTAHASFGEGSYVVVDSGAAAEVQVVEDNTGTSLTTSPVRFTHAIGVEIYQLTASNTAVVHVVAG